MGRVITGDGIHGAIRKCRQQRFPVVGRAQRRIHLEIGVKIPDIVIGQGEVMGRNLAAHAGAVAFPATDDGPSFIEQFCVTRVSSACWITGKLISADVRSASRMVVSLRMGLPSSLTATAPARCKARKSVSTAPLLAWVAAATGNTLTTAPRCG